MKIEKVRSYLVSNFEKFFTLTILATTLVIYYIAPYKVAFLDLFYLPVLFAGYFLGRKHSVLGAFLSIILMGIFVYIDPKSFLTGGNKMDVIFNLTTWGGILMLAAYITGTLHEKLLAENRSVENLNKSLEQTNQQLETANKDLEEHSQSLVKKSKELEEKAAVITHLKERLETALYSTMDTRVAKLVIEKRLRNEKRNISVLFSDLAGFTDFSDKYRPEVIIDELNKFFGQMEPIILKYKGHIDKYLGDGIMCEFGAPVDYKLHALHAVVAGLKMQDTLKSFGQSWNMRVGISSGYAITGLIGSKKQSYTAIGDVVNLANRLQEICPNNSIVVDQETFRDIQPYVEFEMLKRKGEQRENIDILQKEIDFCLQKLSESPGNIDILFRTGTLYFALQNPSSAIEYFKKALDLDPDNNEIKIAYADATLKKDYYEKISIKGKRERIAVYQILGLKDPIKDRNKIPDSFYSKYKDIEKKIPPLEDIILPVEVIDGSIGSSKIVAIISYAIANELGLADSEKNKIMTAGYLRDIGKEAVPSYVLNREGTLTDIEFREVIKHSLEGMVTLQTLGYDDTMILNILRDHHECPDGSGYPDRKNGREISIGAKIVSVADTYDALTSIRPYRDAWDRHAVIQEIQRGVQKGKYDKKVVDALLEVLS